VESWLARKLGEIDRQDADCFRGWMFRNGVFVAYLLAVTCPVRLAFSADPLSPEVRRLLAERQSWHSSIEYGKTLVGDRPQNEFVQITFNELPAEIRHSLDLCMGWILQKDVQPLERHIRPIKPRNDLHLRVGVIASRKSSENDLVEYEWDFNGRPLRIVASLNAVKIDFDLNAVKDGSLPHHPVCVQEAVHWLEGTLNLRGSAPALHRDIEYSVEMPWPDRFDDGIEFSSAPEMSIWNLPGFERWYVRVDALVENATLSILIYRKVGQLMGYQDGSKWFPDDFRAVVLERMRAQAAANEETALQPPQSPEPEAEPVSQSEPVPEREKPGSPEK
jgi:hypothetical protein